MTVTELIAVLKERPQDARVYVWDGDDSSFSEVDVVSEPSKYSSSRTLPEGVIVIWGA